MNGPRKMVNLWTLLSFGLLSRVHMDEWTSGQGWYRQKKRRPLVDAPATVINEVFRVVIMIVSL